MIAGNVEIYFKNVEIELEIWSERRRSVEIQTKF